MAYTMTWKDRYLQNLEQSGHTLYLSGMEAGTARRDGYIKIHKRPGWHVGDTVDIYTGSGLGWTGTITEENAGECVIEIW